MSDPYVGEIKIFSFGFVPRNYVACDGRTLPVNQYQALFALLGTRYGGDGRQNFGVPDLRGRTPMHFRNAGQDQVPLGSMAGLEQVTLNPSQLPAHTHMLMGTSQAATQRPVTGGAFANDASDAVDFFAAADQLQPADYVTLSPQSLGSAGSSQPHNNMQPYQVVNFCIAVLGFFPARN